MMREGDAAEIADGLIAMVGERAEASVIISGGHSELTRFANSFIHQNVGENNRSITLNLSKEGRSASVSTTRSDAVALSDLVDSAFELAALRPRDPWSPGLAPQMATPSVDHYDRGTAGATPDERADVVHTFVEAGGGMMAAGYCETTTTELTFANTADQRCTGVATRAIVDGIHQTPTSAGSAHQASTSLGDLDGGKMGRLAAAKAQAGLDAVDLKPGSYEVVLESNCVGTLLIFLAFYGFNGKAANEQRSFVVPGDQQFDSQISLFDDPLDPLAFALGFDLEGTPRRRLPLIEAGKSRGHAYDRRSAREAGAESTGHGLGKSLYGAGPVPMNLFLEPGDRSTEDMIASVDRGLLVTEFNYCRVLDPRTVGVTGLTRNGTFLIENGQISHPVTNLRFTQSFVEALGPDRVLGIESSGRMADSDFGPGLSHAPSLHLAEWNFTGGAAG